MIRFGQVYRFITSGLRFEYMVIGPDPHHGGAYQTVVLVDEDETFRQGELTWDTTEAIQREYELIEEAP